MGPSLVSYETEWSSKVWEEQSTLKKGFELGLKGLYPTGIFPAV